MPTDNRPSTPSGEPPKYEVKDPHPPKDQDKKKSSTHGDDDEHDKKKSSKGKDDDEKSQSLDDDDNEKENSQKQKPGLIKRGLKKAWGAAEKFGSELKGIADEFAKDWIGGLILVAEKLIEYAFKLIEKLFNLLSKGIDKLVEQKSDRKNYEKLDGDDEDDHQKKQKKTNSNTNDRAQEQQRKQEQQRATERQRSSAELTRESSNQGQQQDPSNVIPFDSVTKRHQLQRERIKRRLEMKAKAHSKEKAKQAKDLPANSNFEIMYMRPNGIAVLRDTKTNEPHKVQLTDEQMKNLRSGESLMHTNSSHDLAPGTKEASQSASRSNSVGSGGGRGGRT